MTQYVKWQQQRQPAWKRTLALVAAFFIFPTGIPWLLLVVLPRWGAGLGWQPLHLGVWQDVLGYGAALVGGAFAIWTVWVQISWADGTPLPMLPTQKLIIRGPYRLCRNPMVLGTIKAYGGLAVVSGSAFSLLFVLLFGAGLVAYLPLMEEKELALRFGAEYEAYKRSTPFLIPRPPFGKRGG